MIKDSNDTVGPWAKEKLGALREYLEFYTRVLKNQGHWLKGTIFVDAFAGPGKARVRAKGKPVPSARTSLFEDIEPQTDPEAIEFLKGSPRVVLDVENPFSRYVFIERDPTRAAELRALADEYGTTRKVSVREGDAGLELQSILESGIDWSKHRAVVFLDPFGMHIPWSVVEALGRTQAIEVLVSFPLGMAIQRFLVRSGDTGGLAPDAGQLLRVPGVVAAPGVVSQSLSQSVRVRLSGTANSKYAGRPSLLSTLGWPAQEGPRRRREAHPQQGRKNRLISSGYFSKLR